MRGVYRNLTRGGTFEGLTFFTFQPKLGNWPKKVRFTYLNMERGKRNMEWYKLYDLKREFGRTKREGFKFYARIL